MDLQLLSRPQSLTTVRSMLSGVAESLEMDPELLDDLKTSVSEACNNVALHAYRGQPGPMAVRLFIDDADRICVAVEDRGVGLRDLLRRDHGPEGIGVSVIQALASEASFASGPDGGTEVVMRFANRRGDRLLFQAPGAVAASLPVAPADDHEIAITLSPVSLLPAVLGRIARALAATAHFSLDRFSDIYLITDTLGVYADQAAAVERIAARVIADDRRLQITAGPFRRGTGALLQGRASGDLGSPLALLADEITIEPAEEHEQVGVTVLDRTR